VAVRRKPAKKKPLRCKAPKRRTVVGKGKSKKVVCRTPPKKRPTTPASRPSGTPPQTGTAKPVVPPAVSPAAPMPAPAPPVVPAPAPTPPLSAPAPDLPVAGTFGVAQAERLLWRAGFGPRPGEAAQLAALGLDAAVERLTRPVGAPTLTGPAPVDEDGQPIAPGDLWGHDHVWWLDRMVRTSQPLVERMALVWHDWFPVSLAKVQGDLVLQQNELFRRHALGSFADLCEAVAVDPAMLVFLDAIDNRRSSINENLARELMELFTLGAGRGAYTEDDVREAARAMTGWRATWTDGVGFHSFRFDAGRHDTGSKTVFGQSGTFGWEDVVRLCLDHEAHASYFVHRLWRQFVPEDPSPQTRAALEALYLGSGKQVRPVLEAILKHPRFYEGPSMVVPPIVLNAGLLRATGQGITTTAWAWVGSIAGQRLFEPPDVSGWDETRWLSTSTWTGRWLIATYAMRRIDPNPWPAAGEPVYSATETAAEALAAARAALGDPQLRADTLAELQRFAETSVPSTLASWQRSPYRAMRQCALRQLIATSSDLQAH
jgi:uncharacterized protein (DUF1800 family)